MRFSLITPSLNQGKFIAETLASVRQASLESGVEVEHIVIDGGSSDETVRILQNQNFAEWISEPDKGQTDAINKGLSRSTGEILGYLCADDLLEPRSFTIVERLFEANPTVDVIYGDGYFLESHSGWKRLKKSGEFSYARLREGNFLLQPSVFFRRAVYEKFGPFDDSLQFCMDHEYWLRIGAETRWLHAGAPLSTSRLHKDAKTSRALGEAWREAARMQARYGIAGKPEREALWMSLVGRHYYRMKRIFFAALGRLKTKS